jgi:hypothetical protein
MATSVRLGTKKARRILESLKVGLNQGPSRFSTRGNPLADYTAAFSPEFLIESFLEEVRSELLEEIRVDMLKDPRTASLANGIGGKQISEKRGGNWKKVPEPGANKFKRVTRRSVGKGRASEPIRLEILQVNEQEVKLTVRLDHPLYVVMHFGSRPHSIPPVGGIHVFPTKEYTDVHGPSTTPYNITKLKSIPWQNPQDKSVPFKKVLKGPIPPTLRSGPNFGRTGSTGFQPPIPFVQRPWRRVIGRKRSQLARLITKKMKAGSGGLQATVDIGGG